MEISNQVRGYHFMLGVFKNQKADPFCSKCSAYANSLAAVKEAFDAFEKENKEPLSALSQEQSRLLSEAKEGLAAISSPFEPVGQKKAGNCKLPEGVCFIKKSLALIRQI